MLVGHNNQLMPADQGFNIFRYLLTQFWVSFQVWN